MAKCYFVTGTDTGVGKTVATALLLAHLRAKGIRALATKPFCSGGTSDVDILHALQSDEVQRSEVNPFHFPEPLAPLVAARNAHQRIPAAEVARHIRGLAARCDVLFIEGAGGILAPLGEPTFPSAPTPNSIPYNLLDIILEVGGHVILVAANKLGVINHTLLSVAAVSTVRSAAKILSKSVALISPPAADISSNSNPRLLQELISPVALRQLPWLPDPSSPAALAAAAKMFGKDLETFF